MGRACMKHDLYYIVLGYSWGYAGSSGGHHCPQGENERKKGVWLRGGGEDGNLKGPLFITSIFSKYFQSSV